MAYTAPNPNGQAVMASSSPVVIASNQSSIPVAATLAAGSALAGKVGIDQTTPGTTNLVAVTGLPAAAAAADALANPTITQVGAANLLFNGTTWDRQRGNFNTTTGDSGTNTVTFNGATQTNYNARGMFAYLVLGAVSGTSPTLTVQFQVSVDSSTQWTNVGAATGAVTATGNAISVTIYPSNISQAAGTTPATLTVGAANQSIALNFPLPRTWRFVYTIGGTTPSFAITAVYVNYLV